MSRVLERPVAPALPPTPPPRRRRRRNWSDIRAGYAFLTPWLLGFVLLTAGPMIASLYLAFTDYNLFAPPQWVGLDNFTRLLSDPDFLQAWKVTAAYVLVGTPVKLAAAFGVALLLDKATGGSGFYRSAFYLPSLVGASVSIAVIWKAMFIDDGPIDGLQQFFGAAPGGWVGDPERTMPMLVLLSAWQFGAPMVIFLAGLRQIPRQYYEAASTDGATRWRQFRSITLPLLSPIIFFNLVLGIIGAFQSFTQAYVVSNGSGGPSDATLFITLYLYQRGFGSFQMGYASSIAWLLLLIVAAATAINFWASKRWVFYDD